jgi:predicted GIY-YIG superfamily endonuclease
MLAELKGLARRLIWEMSAYNIRSIMDWIYRQNNSDKILFEGITRLKNSITCDWLQVDIINPGNYLIVSDDLFYYIGEAKSLKERLKQQFTPCRSTFYKNYTEKINGNLKIEDFKVNSIKTSIGRKEMEEFGIVNLPTILNKFQLSKRNKVSFSKIGNVWEKVQSNSEELLIQGEMEFLKQPVLKWVGAAVPKSAGVYAVFDNSHELIYIGEGSNINKRYMNHSKRTYISALRRHIATNRLEFTLKTIKGKARYLSETEDNRVTAFLRDCQIAFLSVNFGRFELEKYLIKKHKPVLNRKDNK